MKPLEYDLVQLCDRYDQGGSYARRSDRKRELRLMAKQLGCGPKTDVPLIC
jgi:hypothetical protein